MVLSISDLSGYSHLLEIMPLKKVNRTDGYDYYLHGRRLGIGTRDPIAECDVRGTVRCIDMLMVSDASTKRDIELVDPGRCADILADLGVFTYELREPPPGAGRQRIGFIAQDVEQALPGAVVTGEDGLKTIDIAQLLAVAVGAAGHMNDELAALQARIVALQARVVVLEREVAHH